MVKRRGPKTDPWGTPSETPEHPDLWFLSCTNCWRSVRYDVNQESDSNASQAVQEQRVRDGIKCCAEVEEDENGKESGVCCMEEVVGDFDQGCFSAMFWTEARLQVFMEVVCVKVGL